MTALTREIFIERAKGVHGDRYDYSLVVYEKVHIKVEIICKEHGSFFQNGVNHITNKAGCPKCKGGVKYSEDELLTLFRDKHGDRYDYDLRDYKRMSSKITITCPDHGKQKIGCVRHLSGTGCPKCAIEKRRSSVITKFSEFVERSSVVHDNKYSYPEQEIHKASDNLKIICPVHGEFIQSYGLHMNGSGCNECGKLVNGGGGFWNYTVIGRDRELAQTPYKLYVVMLEHDNGERFFKVGLTKLKNVNNRFRKFKPYRYHLVQLIEGTLETLFELEQFIISESVKYKPQHYFKGETECFTSHIGEITSEL